MEVDSRRGRVPCAVDPICCIRRSPDSDDWGRVQHVQGWVEGRNRRSLELAKALVRGYHYSARRSSRTV